MAQMITYPTSKRLDFEETIMKRFRALVKSSGVTYWNMKCDRPLPSDPTNPNACIIVYHFTIENNQPNLHLLNVINETLSADNINIICDAHDGWMYEAVWNYIE